MTTETFSPLEMRIKGALELILSLYNVPEEVRKREIEKALSTDYRSLGIRIVEEFKGYVDRETEQALLHLLERKQPAKEAN